VCRGMRIKAPKALSGNMEVLMVLSGVNLEKGVPSQPTRGSGPRPDPAGNPF